MWSPVFLASCWFFPVPDCCVVICYFGCIFFVVQASFVYFIGPFYNTNKKLSPIANLLRGNNWSEVFLGFSTESWQLESNHLWPVGFCKHWHQCTNCSVAKRLQGLADCIHEVISSWIRQNATGTIDKTIWTQFFFFFNIDGIGLVNGFLIWSKRQLRRRVNEILFIGSYTLACTEVLTSCYDAMSCYHARSSCYHDVYDVVMSSWSSWRSHDVVMLSCYVMKYWRQPIPRQMQKLYHWIRLNILYSYCCHFHICPISI